MSVLKHFYFYSVSNDFIEIMGSFTYNGGINDKREIIPASRFCGVFDGQDLIFPGITSKDKVFCQLVLLKSNQYCT